jgi:hypothetical protein
MNNLSICLNADRARGKAMEKNNLGIMSFNNEVMKQGVPCVIPPVGSPYPYNFLSSNLCVAIPYLILRGLM